MSQEDQLSELKNKSWLSKWVREEVKKRYPQLVPAPWYKRIVSSLQKWLRLPITWAVVVFLLFLSVNELLLTQGIILVIYKLNSASTSDVLASFIDALAAMLGIVIPLVILVIEFLGRDSSDVIDIYLDNTEIKTTALSALVVLALHGAAKLIINADLVPVDRFYFYTLVLLSMFDLAVLFGVGVALEKVRRSLDNDFFIRAFLERIRRDVKENQFEEVEYRYSRIVQINISQILELRRSFLPQIPSKMPPNVVPLLASESGIITDVDIPKWLKFGQTLEVKFKTDPSVKGYIVRFIGDSVSKDDPVVYVVPGEDQEVKDLQSMLDQSLRIERKIHSKGTDVSRLLEQLKAKTRLAVREEDDVLFDQFLGMYLSIFDLGIGLPAPPSDSLIPQLFSGWNVITTIIFHLGDIVEITTQSRNEHLIRELALRLSIVVEAIIQQSDTHISESLWDILNLFVTIYLYGRRYNNQIGIQSSYSYLTENVVDRAWVKKLEQVYSDQEALNNLKRILFSIFYTLVRIVQSMIEHHDLDNLKTLLNKLAPGEFLARPRFILQQVESETWRLQRQNRSTSQEEINDVTAQLQVRISALNILQEYTDSFDELIFVATSYALEGYDLGEIESTRVKEVINELQPYLPSHIVGLASLLVRLTTDFSQRMSWMPFHRHPDTKQTFSPDDNAKFYLFYCLYGLKLLSTPNDLSDKFPAAEFQHRLDRIKEFCDRIIDMPDKWSPIVDIIPPAIPEKVGRFWELHQQMKEKWQRDREEKIIAADLDPQKILAFEKAFKGAIKAAPSLRSFLEGKGRIVCNAKVRSKRKLGYSTCRDGEKEYFTTLYPDIARAEQVGEEYGYKMALTENSFLVQEWVQKARTLRSRKDWLSLKPYVERALAYMDGEGYQATLIIIPSDVSYYFLLNTPNFRADSAAQDSLNLPELHGFYNEIPVLQWYDNLDNNILVIDVEKVSQLEIGDVKAEVKLLEESVRKRMQKDKPDLTDRQLQLSVWILVSEKIRVKKLDKNAAVKLPAKVPEHLRNRPLQLI